MLHTRMTILTGLGGGGGGGGTFVCLFFLKKPFLIVTYTEWVFFHFASIILK